jgi:hypothetical protein
MVAQGDAGGFRAGSTRIHTKSMQRAAPRRVHFMEEKSRHEIVLRAKISYGEQRTNMSLRGWVDRELCEIGMQPINDTECQQYNLNDRPRIFQDV